MNLCGFRGEGGGGVKDACRHDNPDVMQMQSAIYFSRVACLDKVVCTHCYDCMLHSIKVSIAWILLTLHSGSGLGTNVHALFGMSGMHHLVTERVMLTVQENTFNEQISPQNGVYLIYL